MRKVLALAFAVVLVAAACGGDDDDEGSTGGTPPVSLPGEVSNHGTKALGSATKLELELDDTYFGPTFIIANAGTKVTVELENEGSIAHTFTIDGMNVDQLLDVGKKATIDVQLPASGSVVFYCRFHRDGGMQGAFVVA
jgi:plastocyanin